MTHNKLSALALVALLTVTTAALGAADRRGPGKGGKIGKGGAAGGGINRPLQETELQNMFQALAAIQQGKPNVAKQELRQAVRSVPFSPVAHVVKGLLKSALTDANSYTLRNKDKVVLVVDGITTALTLSTSEKSKEWNDKAEMRSAIQLIRVAKFISKKGFEGRALASVIAAKTELIEFSHAPKINKAMGILQRAERKLSENRHGPVVQGMLTDAIHLVRSAHIFKRL